MEVIAFRKYEKKPIRRLVDWVVPGGLLFCFSLIMICAYVNDPEFFIVQLLAMMVFVLPALWGIGCGIKQYKRNIYCNKLPKEALYKERNTLKIIDKEEITLNISDIIKVRGRRYVGFDATGPCFETHGVLTIKTTSKKYVLENIEDIEEVKDILKSYISNK